MRSGESGMPPATLQMWRVSGCRKNYTRLGKERDATRIPVWPDGNAVQARKA
jgi:hypothetical protein